VDVAGKARKPADKRGFEAPPSASTQVGGRSVDVETQNGRLARKQKELISRNFAKPSGGLELPTPSL
jgi:hypothetical protein